MLRQLRVGYFIDYYSAVPLKMYLADQNVFWLAKIGQKMANG